MKKEVALQLNCQFEGIVHVVSDSEVAFWYARELQEALGYDRWENFKKVIEKAINSCETLGVTVLDHFRDVTKMVKIGFGAERPIEDIMLTRYACYLIAQNGDPRKEQIAFAQTYFAVQTRKQELIEERIRLRERMQYLKHHFCCVGRFGSTFLLFQIVPSASGQEEDATMR